MNISLELQNKSIGINSLPVFCKVKNTCNITLNYSLDLFHGEVLPLLPPPSLLSPSLSSETIKLMRPEVGAAAAGGCSRLLSSPLSFPSITLSFSLILSLTLSLLVFQSLFPSPSRPSVDLLSVACCCCRQTFAVLQQKLCYSGDSGDRHFISALLTSWW